VTITIGWPEAVLIVIVYGTGRFVTALVIKLIELRALRRAAMSVSSGDPAPGTPAPCSVSLPADPQRFPQPGHTAQPSAPLLPSEALLLPMPTAAIAPPHPTCIDASTIGAGRGTYWVCGPDCP
jgi:hypothetical protein